MDNYKNTFETWNKLAHNYQGKFMDFDLYDDTYNLFCEWVEKPNAKIFEIGCGPGNITRYLLNKRPDFKIDATDVAPNMVAVAQENNPTAKCSILDCRELDKVKTKYDAVMCGFCMPYLSKTDCVKLISDAANMLNEKGVLYFSAIEGDYKTSTYETSSDGQHTMFVYYHQEDYLQDALKAANFKEVIVKRKQYEKANSTTQTHIIFIARKGKDNINAFKKIKAMSNIIIERIESEKTLELCAGILVDAYNAEPWNDNWTKEKALEKLTCFYNSPKFIGWTAQQDNKLLGCCVGNIEPYYTGDYYYLKEMFVLVQAQKKGIGAKLMATVKTHLESIDIKTIILFTGKGFFPFNFYLKSGFKEMDGMRMMHFEQTEQ